MKIIVPTGSHWYSTSILVWEIVGKSSVSVKHFHQAMWMISVTFQPPTPRWQQMAWCPSLANAMEVTRPGKSWGSDFFRFLALSNDGISSRCYIYICNIIYIIPWDHLLRKWAQIIGFNHRKIPLDFTHGFWTKCGALVPRIHRESWEKWHIFGGSENGCVLNILGASPWGWNPNDKWTKSY